MENDKYKAPDAWERDKTYFKSDPEIASVSSVLGHSWTTHGIHIRRLKINGALIEVTREVGFFLRESNSQLNKIQNCTKVISINSN